MRPYSPFRSTATFKPQAECPAVDIYICRKCGRSFQALGHGGHAAPECCGGAMESLVPLGEENFPEAFKISYSITGGLDYDAVKVGWRCPEGVKPEWILLKTFTGSYIRYLTPKKKAPMIFALADEDAYVYCDKPVCERCTFRCKLGFAVYAYFAEPEPLLLTLDLNKVAPRFRTKI